MVVEGVGASDSVGCDVRAAAEGSMRSGIDVDKCMCEWRIYFGWKESLFCDGDEMEMRLIDCHDVSLQGWRKALAERNGECLGSREFLVVVHTIEVLLAIIRKILVSCPFILHTYPDKIEPPCKARSYIGREITPFFHASCSLVIATLQAGNSSSSFSLAMTFILSSSWIRSFAAYGIVIFVIPSVFLHVWQYP